jgi:hypothetical protein
MATIFNINDTHVKYLRIILKTKDLAIIHGDGQIFSCNDEETTKVRGEKGGRTITLAQKDSEHHREYNSGYDEFERTAIAKFRAVYRKGDALPETPEEIIEAFYKQVDGDTRERMGIKAAKASNVFNVDEGEKKEEVKEAVIEKPKADSKPKAEAKKPQSKTNKK